MRIGIHYANFTHPDWQFSLTDRLTETATVADQGGASLFTVMDHWFQMENLGGPAEPMLEGYTTLGYLAGQTESVRLSLLVTGTTYRYPGLLAKIVTTLDVLSKGRATLGIGAAWYDREHAGLGVPFPSMSERFERLEETLHIVRQMWSDEDGAYDGKHYQLAETVCVPPPSRGRVPVLIGGSGEKKTLRLVAQYADATNLIVAGPDEAKHKLEVLKQHCDDLGRDYDSIEKTAQARLQPGFTADEILATASALAAVGIEHVHFGVLGPDPAASIARFGDEVASRLAEVSVAH